MDFLFHDLITGSSGGIDLVLPGFDPAHECVVFLSPHDDDAILGAGYMIQAVVKAGASAGLMVMCDGSAGYSRIEDREGIVARRKSETIAAYGLVGLHEPDLAWLDFPDFSAVHYLGWRLPGGSSGVFAKMVPLLRQWKATRLFIPNGRREHMDHLAAHLAGLYFGPQAGDAVVADWGEAASIRTTMVYSVWSDFPPAPGRTLRADRAITAPPEAEMKVMEAIEKFESQSDVIEDLVRQRKGRIRDGRALELYLSIEPRPRLDFSPYWKVLE